MKQAQSSILVKSAIEAMFFAIRGGAQGRELERVMVRYLAGSQDIIYPIEHYKSRSIQKNTITLNRNNRAAKELHQARKELNKVVDYYICLVREEAALLTGKEKWEKLKDVNKIRSASYTLSTYLKNVRYFLDNRSTKIDIVRKMQTAKAA